MISSTRSLRTGAALATLALMLTACGGGGGSGGGSTQRHDLAQAFKQWHLSGQSVGLQGQDACLGTLVYAQTPAQAGTHFEGQAALSGGLTLTTLVQPACPLASGIDSRQAYYTADGIPLGYQGTAEYAVYTTTPNYPNAAQSGDSGEIGQLTRYAGTGKGQIVGSDHISYTLQQDSGASTATLLVTLQRRDAAQVLQGTDQQRFRLTQDNTLELIAIERDGTVFSR